MWNHCIVIPSELYDEVLSQLHSTHLGIVKKKNLARSYFWFPHMEEKIEQITKNCPSCIYHATSPPKVKIVPWPTPRGPWERLHIDCFEYNKKYYLVVIDGYTKWVEVVPMSNISTSLTIMVLRTLFSRFGLLILYDNGPAFVSAEFEIFLRNNNIKHIQLRMVQLRILSKK